MTALKNGKERENHIRFTYKNKNGKRVPYEIVTSDLNWRSYTGSYDKTEYENNDILSREIISFHGTDKGRTYAEMKMLFNNNVLLDNMCRNKNIQGTLYAKDIEEIKVSVKDIFNFIQ